MKLKVPKFDFDFTRFEGCKRAREVYCNNDIKLDFYDVSGLPFIGHITMDSFGDTFYVYGFISFDGYSDEVIVASEVRNIKTVKQLISAYKKVKKELQSKYKLWVKQNLYINK